jgi:hypothetical protein
MTMKTQEERESLRRAWTKASAAEIEARDELATALDAVAAGYGCDLAPAEMLPLLQCEYRALAKVTRAATEVLRASDAFHKANEPVESERREVMVHALHAAVEAAYGR